MRAPEAPIGWPSATAPPLTLTRPRRCRACGSSCSVTDANASLISHRSMSPGCSPAFVERLLRRVGGRRREVGEVVGDRGLGDDRRRARSLPLAAAHSSEASTSAPAPSLTPGELPAVCEPSFVKIGGSLASASSDVSRRGASSTSTTVSPFLPLTVTATISSGRRPSSVAVSAQLVRAQRPAVHVRARHLELGARPRWPRATMCLPLNGLREPVVDHRVDRLARRPCGSRSGRPAAGTARSTSTPCRRRRRPRGRRRGSPRRGCRPRACPTRTPC